MQKKGKSEGKEGTRGFKHQQQLNKQAKEEHVPRIAVTESLQRLNKVNSFIS